MASSRVKLPKPPQAVSHTRYEDDLYTWVEEQAALLRAGKLSQIDALNIAEELSDVGNEQLDKLESAFTVLTQHFLKWDHQPARRSRSWDASIREQRKRIRKLLKKNPGLKSKLPEAIEDGYSYGRDRAYAETGLDEVLPAICPYSLDELMTRPIVFEPSPPKKHKTG